MNHLARSPKSVAIGCKTLGMSQPFHDVRDALRTFVAEREWGQFHSPASLSRSIVIEAGELLECFQWSDAADAAAVKSELADVLTYAYLLADQLGLDPGQIVMDKLAVTAEKYPAERARGRSDKYDRLPD